MQKDYASLSIADQHALKRFALDWKRGKRSWEELSQVHDVDETLVDAIVEAMKVVEVSKDGRDKFILLMKGRVSA